MVRRVLGIDWVETAIHVVVTVCAGVVLSEAAGPSNEDMTLAMVFAGSAVVFGFRRRRALRQSDAPEGLTSGEMAAERIADLEARVADLEAAQGRLAELEERMDFSERLVTRSPVVERAAFPDEPPR
jgi:hypothetical protein